MTITLTIDPAVESIGIQAIAKALGITNVTDLEAKGHLAAHLKTVTASLYLRGDQLQRQETADASALNAASTYITVV